jgi:DNA primase
VLVFDADAGGATGVDRALEIFISEDVELMIATLPQGDDPCDLLAKQGPEPFKKALKNAVDALDFKMDRLLEREDYKGIDGTRRVVDAVLGLLAMAPEMPGKAGQVKRELILNRVAHRLGLRLETAWARLGELRDARKKQVRPAELNGGATTAGAEADEPKSGPAPELEREFMQHLLADPALVPLAARAVQPDELTHPGLRALLIGLYQLRASGEPPDLDGLRAIVPNPALISWAMDQAEIGRHNANRKATFERALQGFRKKREAQGLGLLKNELSAATDHGTAIDILRKLQKRSGGSDS